MHRWATHRFTLPLIAGVALGVGYYTELLLPLLLALTPVLYWLDRNGERSRWYRFTGSFVFGFAAAIIGLHFCYAMLEFSWLAAVLWVWFAGLLALKLSSCLMVASWLRRRTGFSWGWTLPIVWVPLDWLLTFGDLRMTGDHAAHAMAAYPFLIQFADLIGHYGVSALVYVVNGLAYDAMLAERRRSRRGAAIALGCLSAAVLAYDAWCWFGPLPERETVRVVYIQPDIPLLVKRGEGTEAEQRSRLAALSRDAAALDPQLVIWPESARPDPLEHWLDAPATYAMPEVQQLARELDSEFLVGVEYYAIRDRDDYDAYNAAVLVRADGRLDPGWVAKVYLVPFVEATPFRAIFGPWVEERDGEWRWLAGGFLPGPRARTLETAAGPAGVLVCYELLFPDLPRELRNAGARFQVVITNDAWFGRTPFQRFLSNATRLRAIENRSEFVRAANSGISGFIDARGRFHERTGLFEVAIAARDVRLSDQRTVYDRIGDSVVGLLALGLVSTAVVARRR
ncbi:MAG TPA: apolipoprotein N-acyltransferase [Candidatus Polarisedimenticolaceae bacterium]|nr:apolipoprotein N-acyltransferase [Candidatus Polarisedimenticolaceae bacterium]